MDQDCIPLDFKKERQRLYVAMSVWNFAQGIVQVFIPIYLFSSGYSLALVFAFFALQQATRALNVPLAAAWCGKIGAKHVLSVSFLFPLVFYTLFMFVARHPFYFVASAMVSGLTMAYGFVSYHFHTSKIIKDGHRGKTLALVGIMQLCALALAPAVGGMLIERFGIFAALLAAFAVSFAAVAMLLGTNEVSKKRPMDTQLLRLNDVARDAVANGFFNFFVVLDMAMWPIFMFFMLKGYQRVGFAEALAAFASVIAVFVVGRILDKKNRKRVFLWSSAAHAFTGMMRLFVSGGAGAVMANMAQLTTFRANSLAWTSIFHHNLDAYPRVEYLMWFEIMGGAIPAAGLLCFAIAAFFADTWTLLYFAIIVGSAMRIVPTIVQYRPIEHAAER